jgi:hypothetical protein
LCTQSGCILALKIDQFLCGFFQGEKGHIFFENSLLVDMSTNKERAFFINPLIFYLFLGLGLLKLSFLDDPPY